MNLLGLVAAIAIVLVAFLAACAVARAMVRAPRSLAPEFVLSLVPIALVYAIAHYFSLFVLQGQYTVPLLSDPLGQGWDLFGTAGVTPNLAVLTPNTVWYVQATALVLGHVAGLVVAHDRAVAIFRDRDDALRSQYAMLGADGRLHDRRPLAALPRMNLLAHGGIPGLIAEIAIGALVAGALGAVWLRERRRRARGERPASAPMRDEEDEAGVEQERRKRRERRRLGSPESGEGASHRRDGEPGQDERIAERSPPDAHHRDDDGGERARTSSPTIASTRAGKSSR